MFDGVEIGGIGGQKEQLATRGFDQPECCLGLVKAGVVQHDHAPGRQCREQHGFKISVHDLRGATALKHQRGDEPALLGGGDDAGAFPPLARHGLVNPFAAGRAPGFTIQAVIHAALVEVKDGLAAELFEFALEEPALHLVALAVFYEFFLR